MTPSISGPDGAAIAESRHGGAVLAVLTSRRAAAAGLLFCLVYFVALGEAAFRDPPIVLRAINAIAAGALLVGYVMLAARSTDRVDRGVLASFLLFAAAGILSAFPRQALDAVLTALVYVAALYFGRTALADGRWRTWFIRAAMALSALLTFLTAARWLPPFVEWWALTDWTVVPPLNMEFAAIPWGHRHDLTLLLLMLYPSWWVGRPRPLRAALATMVGILVTAIVIVDGSRTLWIALALASIVAGVIVTVRHRDWVRRYGPGLGAVALVGLVVLALSGSLGLLADRALNTTSLSMRAEMWQPLVQAWWSKPLAGHGPGSFPWILQTTPYFDANSLAPRHPDSAIVQVMAEAGVLGVASVLVLLGTVIPRVIRGSSLAAAWALALFALTGLAASPTDFGFLVAVAIGWTAYGVPRTDSPVESPESVANSTGRRPIQVLGLAALAVIGFAWGATSIADTSYESARRAILAGKLDEARSSLGLAIALDPGMALYPRQLATLDLVEEAPAEALELAREAVDLNPSDDVAWRLLALAEIGVGDARAGRSALGAAVDTQRSDSANLLLTARLQVDGGATDEALGSLQEVVQAWPEIVAAPGWDEMLPPGVTTDALVHLALDRWLTGRVSPEPRALQPVTLAVMAGQHSLALDLADEALGPSLGPAFVAVTGCEIGAREMLDSVPSGERRQAVYWQLAQRLAALEGRRDERAERILAIMSGALGSAERVDEAITPVNENSRGYSADVWGYRRTPIIWPSYEPLPSPVAGLARWLAAPREAAAEAGLLGTMARCD